MNAPSMTTCPVPPLGGSARRGAGDSTQPKLATADPLTVPPCAGVSMAPNGAIAVLFVHTIVLLPSVVECPSASSAIAYSLNVPLPRLGRKLVSIKIGRAHV